MLLNSVDFNKTHLYTHATNTSKTKNNIIHSRYFFYTILTDDRPRHPSVIVTTNTFNNASGLKINHNKRVEYGYKVY